MSDDFQQLELGTHVIVPVRLRAVISNTMEHRGITHGVPIQVPDQLAWSGTLSKMQARLLPIKCASPYFYSSILSDTCMPNSGIWPNE